MKKASILVVIVVLLVGFIVSIPLVNNFSAKNIEKQLIGIDLPNNTELIESISKADKLVGNGNGMQYFGAMLIRSDQSLEELSAYYSHKLDNIIVRKQKTGKIECVEHGELFFKTPITETEDYFIVYVFGEGVPLFSGLDIRGH